MMDGGLTVYIHGENEVSMLWLLIITVLLIWIHKTEPIKIKPYNPQEWTNFEIIKLVQHKIPHNPQEWTTLK
jgi:hypothetical protein